MTDFVVHTVLGSPYGRAALVALEEKGAAYRIAPVVPGTLRAPSHLALHPFGRVPVVEHGSFRLYETQAILRYIERILPRPAMTPANPQAAGRMDQLMNVADWYLFQGVANVIVFERLLAPRFFGRAADESAIAAATPKARSVFEVLARQLGDQPYFVGGAVTLADAHLAPHLDFFSETPEWEPLTASHPNLRAWVDRMRERPSLAATTRDRVVARAQQAA